MGFRIPQAKISDSEILIRLHRANSSPSPILLRNLRKLDSRPPETREEEGLLELDVENQGNRPEVTQVFCQCRGKYDQVTVYI